MEGEIESIVMPTSDPKSMEQNEKKLQNITENIQSSISSSTKQEEADSTGGRREAAQQPSLWNKCKKLLKGSRGQKTKLGKPDESSPTTASEKLTASIDSDISFISEAAKELDDYYGGIITKKLDKLKGFYDEIKKKKKTDEKVENFLRDLSEDLMRLKLVVPLKIKGGAEKNNPENLKLRSEEIFEGWGASEMMPQLHMSEVLGSSMELEEFVARYNRLERPMKLCLLCFSIFPKDAIIKKRLMVQWWVVEGYAATEGVAAGYFEELIEKGFLEAVNDNRSPTVGCCRIHPFSRSALVALAERAKLFNFGGDGKPTQNFSGCFQACLMGAGLISYDDFNVMYNSKSLVKDNEYQKKVIEGKINELKKLHLLINVDEHILEFVDEWLSKMENLNILRLGRWNASAAHHIEVEDAKFLKKLENMRYVKLISFQGVSNIIVLPDSILKMRKLEVLDLRACYNLEAIPERMGSMLKMLTHLDMSECYLLSHMPKSLSQLTQLKVLKGFFVGEDEDTKGCTLDELGNLKYLEKLCIYTKWKGFLVEGDVPDLELLASLTKLTITWGVSHFEEEQKQKQKQKPSPKKNGKVAKLPSTLTKLDLKCFPMSETPEWLKLKNLRHTELTKLYIRGGEFSDLGQYQDIDEDESERSTWKVEVLRLKYLGKIEMEWRTLHHLFPNLKYLEKVSCPKLTLFPCTAYGVWIKPAP